MAKGMIDESALKAAIAEWERPKGWIPHLHRAIRKAIEAYEAAKLAAIPDPVEVSEEDAMAAARGGCEAPNAEADKAVKIALRNLHCAGFRIVRAS
jgi:hypothetical protein